MLLSVVRGIENIHCPCRENQVISRQNDVIHFKEMGRKSAKLILKREM